MPFDIWLIIPAVFFGISWVVMFDAVAWSDAHWDGASLPKLRWFLILAFLGVIGAALYWFRARPRLENINVR